MHEGKRKSIFPGLILIAIGILFLLINFNLISVRANVIWTYLIIVIGAVFWISFFFDRSNPGVLMPGTVLLTVGIVLNIGVRSDASWRVLWPFFVMAPAFGFYAMYFFGKRERGLLFPAAVLTIIGLFFFLQALDFAIQLVFGIVMILVGVLLIVRYVQSLGEGDRGDRGRPGEGG
jgi:hypothetical protein